MSMKRCENCDFWVKTQDRDPEGELSRDFWQGECRRHAPVRDPDRNNPDQLAFPANAYVFPNTTAATWCGDLRYKGQPL